MDPIADMLTRVRNALAARHTKVDIPSSKLKVEVARILKEEGYINNYKVAGEGARKAIRVYLRYGPKGEMVLHYLKRVSKPGSRVYVKNSEIPNVLGGLGINIVSTSKGLMTGKQARQAQLGGELLCNIY
ncbi:MAG: 30S ribosomal protein S8 [Blastocatellia bacterium]|jgi:small subunit ribosomal protein S8|nr:30S ribosomal protein S8 [Blastocatellia bacterium]MBN8723233.1 30S ribosomal protein S8 [Acidobacteriota bacterium]